MTFKEALQKIKESEDYKKFISENLDAELCAGFFITDFFGNDNKQSLDYKTNDKVFTFSIDELGKIKTNQDKLIESESEKFPELKKIDADFKVDLDEINSIARVRALDEGIAAKFSKIIAVLQKHEQNNKIMQIWNLTCMLEGLIILHILIDADTGEVIKFERKSMMDLIRKKL